MQNPQKQPSYQQQHAQQLKKILAAMPKDSDKTLKHFVQQFYQKVPVSDLQHYDPKRAVALAQSAFDFMRTREKNQPKIRIFTPHKDTHGYDSKYTVVELLNDDMPFLVDSLSAELGRHGFSIRETLHPIFALHRDKSGVLQELAEEDAEAQIESLIHFEISNLPEGLAPEKLAEELKWVLTYIRAAVEDWRKITTKVGDTTQRLKEVKGVFDARTVAEVKDFLDWLIDRNFIFLGYAEYDFYDSQGKEHLSAVPGSKLGILKIADDVTLRGLEAMPSELRHFLLVPQLIEVTKSNRRSVVHRPVPMDYIGIKRFNADGKVIGEARFLGLFTSNVYYQSTDQIPLVRQKIANVLEHSDFDPNSHDGKALKTIFEFLPRDEIFQMSEEELFETGMGILALEAKPGVRVFIRRDAFERFVSCMIFVPRERFSTELRRQIESIIGEAFNGSTFSFSTQITEAPLARLHLIIKTQPGNIPSIDVEKIENEIAKRAYLWGELLLDALLKQHGEAKAEKLQRAYGAAFPQNYINRYGTSAAVYDIGKMEEAIASGGMALELFRDKSEAEGFIHLKTYNPNEEIALSDLLPMLENAGFRVIDEHPFPVTPQGLPQVWIRDFKLKIAGSTPLAIDDIKPLLEEALLRVWRLEAENDRFNTLVLKAGLAWRQVAALRAYAKYLRQIGFTYPQATIEQAMIHHPDVARSLSDLFIARFSLNAPKNKQATLQEIIEQQLAKVENAAFDRILRRYADIILATLRTNFFQEKGGEPKPVISFKFDSAKVPDLPLPRPFVEIFVYSPRVEGIHLRGGKVARGGLRWSDRHDDFRTEVLGLMKAQMVKNSVIVPVGSKGGFVVKRPPSSREGIQEEGVACYTLYLQGLLDITDNIIKGKVVPPAQTVRYDEDDPYLVVAADKGTATFSDIANRVSQSYNFWLGDAFASGGSAGYDHKAMGITARGAWISVERHFCEMGVDIDKQSFTCTGIGDMSGDVFGNGMLLSNRIKLVAAFNHMHIFIDPTPDEKSSFAERQRLFKLPRSSWKDYDVKLISKGGGVYERSAKSISLSKEAQTALGINKTSLPPDEVIRAILMAPVDLLWNGGIGTYVKAEEETHEQVGDRTNNTVRVNGKDLRCKVVGEGGNLGFTQKGRIEYAHAGGRINTDAIDNSAGVDCSDHEVNIKIAFSQVMAAGKLTLKKRDELLAAMTDEVAELVLKDNRLQTQALSIAEHQGFKLLESQAQMMRRFEREGFLNREVEFLPNDKQLAELKATRKGLTRPSLAVLLAYSKMMMYKELLDSSLPDEAYFHADLQRYFPKRMQQDFAEAILAHPLKREIIATITTNSLVNRAGITFAFDIAEDLGASMRDIAAAYALARDVFGLRALWKEIKAAVGIGDAQLQMTALVSEFLGRVAVWLLRNLPLPLDINRVHKEVAPDVSYIEQHRNQLHSHITRQSAQQLYDELTGKGVPPALADKISGLELMSSAFDIIAIAHKTGLAAEVVGKLYFEIGARLHLGWLRLSAANLPTASHWERLAVQSMIGDLYDEQRRVTISAIETIYKDKKNPKDIEAWASAHKEALERLKEFIDELKASDTQDVPRLLVALRHIRSL